MGSLAWKELLQDYPVSTTPNDLANRLKNGELTGAFTRYGYIVPYNATEKDGIITVSSEKIGSGGIGAGGNYLVNGSNLRECVEDF